jgi:phosphatidylserine/phosphatidylglycerophosphate/cardiolipin synthase-like enzyme
MKQSLFVATVFFALVAGMLIGYYCNSASISINSPKICLNGSADAIISPGADVKLISAMDSAKESIHIILFEFSFSGLKEALVNAREREVSIKLILDPKVDQNLDTADFLKGKGIEVRWSSKQFVYTHAKTAIIDGKRAIIGSINWSRNAMTKNREIGVIIDNERLAGELEEVFWQDWNDATDVK